MQARLPPPALTFQPAHLGERAWRWARPLRRPDHLVLLCRCDRLQALRLHPHSWVGIRGYACCSCQASMQTECHKPQMLTSTYEFEIYKNYKMLEHAFTATTTFQRIQNPHEILREQAITRAVHKARQMAARCCQASRC